MEAQHLVSTRRLVDSAGEQALLEQMIDRVKPPPRTEPELKGLHYLLMTPFRHPPLRYGSRFGTRAERGIFYASDEVRTAFAELSYYRFLFLAGTEAKLPRLLLELTAFRVTVRSKRAVDLVAPPFDAHRQKIASRTKYEATQALGQRMRADGIEAFRYPSARDVEGGVNVGLFSPRAFGRKTPHAEQTWLCDLTWERAELTRKNVIARAERYVYERTGFEVRGRLPSPAV